MATAPKDPTLENYIFCRWQTSAGRSFFFEYYPVEEDLALEAIWIKATDLFELAPMPDSQGVMITDIKRQEEFTNLIIPSVINGKTVEGLGDEAFSSIVESHAKKIVFPETIHYIGDSALEYISTVEFTLRGTVSHVGEKAFYKTTKLNSVKLGVGIERIPFEAFAMCTSLRTIDIPEGTTLIEENAFEGCSAMVTVVLPASLAEIENGAFESCSKIKSVFFKGTQAQFDAIKMAPGNESVELADIYYYSEEEPAQPELYWHYDKNGTPVIW